MAKLCMAHASTHGARKPPWSIFLVYQDLPSGLDHWPTCSFSYFITVSRKCDILTKYHIFNHLNIKENVKPTSLPTFKQTKCIWFRSEFYTHNENEEKVWIYWLPNFATLTKHLINCTFKYSKYYKMCQEKLEIIFFKT